MYQDRSSFSGEGRDEAVREGQVVDGFELEAYRQALLGGLGHVVQRVGGDAFRMVMVVLGDSLGHQAELVAGHSVRDYENASVRLALLKEVDGKSYEVVAIARHQTAALLRGERQVNIVVRAEIAAFVGRHNVHVHTPGNLCYPSRQVLIEIEPHASSSLRRHERITFPSGFGGPLFVPPDAFLYLIGICFGISECCLELRVRQPMEGFL